MAERNELALLLQGLIRELLKEYDRRVPERSAFPDIRAGRTYSFGDPTTTLPGRIELVLMNMDARLDPKYDYLRFLSVRVMKSRDGGYASVTCLHGNKKELRSELEELLEDTSFLVDRVRELAEGLPEETDPDIWR